MYQTPTVWFPEPYTSHCGHARWLAALPERLLRSEVLKGKPEGVKDMSCSGQAANSHLLLSENWRSNRFPFALWVTRPRSHNLLLPHCMSPMVSHKHNWKGFLFSFEKRVPLHTAAVEILTLLHCANIAPSASGLPPSHRRDCCNCRHHSLDPYSSCSPSCRLPVSATLLPADLQGHQAARVYK